jgi:hypothetical protein
MSNSMKAMRVVRGISQSLCMVLLLLACGALSAQNQEHRVRNIALVHGAWAYGSGWKGVYDILVIVEARRLTTRSSSEIPGQGA